MDKELYHAIVKVYVAAVSSSHEGFSDLHVLMKTVAAYADPWLRESPQVFVASLLLWPCYSQANLSFVPKNLCGSLMSRTIKL